MSSTNRNATPDPGRRQRRSAEILAQWITDHADILRGLAAFRRLGAPGETVVAAALALTEVARMRPSWQLWEAIAEGEGHDVQALVQEFVPVDLFQTARFALWGDGSGIEIASGDLPRRCRRHSARKS